MGHVVELCARFNDRGIERTSIDSAAGADLHVVFDHQMSDLGELVISACLFIVRETEPVTAEDAAGMDEHTIAHDRLQIDGDVRNQLTVLAERDVFTQHTARPDSRAGSNPNIAAHHSVRADRDMSRSDPRGLSRHFTRISSAAHGLVRTPRPGLGHTAGMKTTLMNP